MDILKTIIGALTGQGSKTALLTVRDLTRQQDALRAIRYYHDISYQKEHLYEEHKLLYKDTAKWKERPKACYNLTRAITDSLCTLYQDPVRRKFENEAYDKVWGEVKSFEKTMQTVDRYTFLAGTVAVRPVWTDDGKMSFALYASNHIEVTCDPEDPKKIISALLTWNTSEGGTYSHLWTIEEFVEAKDDSVVSRSNNPYGVIPLVFFNNDDNPWEFFDVPATDLILSNLTLNKLMTDLNYTVTFQTHGQLVLKGAPLDYVPALGPSTYLTISDQQGADAKYINPSADISQAIEAINLNLEMFFASRRIPESIVRAKESSAKSGISIIAEQASLADWRKRRIVTMRDSEAALIDLTLKTIAYHKTGAAFGGDPIGVVLDYQDLQIPMSAEQQSEWTWRFQNKLATPIDWLMAQNPDLTEKTALELYKKNVKFSMENDRVPMPLKTNDKGMPGVPPQDQGVKTNE